MNAISTATIHSSATARDIRALVTANAPAAILRPQAERAGALQLIETGLRRSMEASLGAGQCPYNDGVAIVGGCCERFTHTLRVVAPSGDPSQEFFATSPEGGVKALVQEHCEALGYEVLSVEVAPKSEERDTGERRYISVGAEGDSLDAGAIYETVFLGTEVTVVLRDKEFAAERASKLGLQVTQDVSSIFASGGPVEAALRQDLDTERERKRGVIADAHTNKDLARTDPGRLFLSFSTGVQLIVQGVTKQFGHPEVYELLRRCNGADADAGLRAVATRLGLEVISIKVRSGFELLLNDPTLAAEWATRRDALPPPALTLRERVLGWFA